MVLSCMLTHKFDFGRLLFETHNAHETLTLLFSRQNKLCFDDRECKKRRGIECISHFGMRAPGEKAAELCCNLSLVSFFLIEHKKD